MIVSFEALPGSKKKEIFKALNERLGLTVHLNHDEQMDRVLKQDHKKNIFCYELDILLRINEKSNMITNSGQINLVSSIVAYKDIFLYHLQKKDTFTQYEQDILSRFYTMLYKPPDYIIYLFGNAKSCYKRHLGQEVTDYTEEEFNEINSQYEWVFDVNNCKIPMFKLNIEDDLDIIVNNIEAILKQIKENS